MIETSSMEAAARAVRESHELALACHVGPDGDALGSMLGLGILAVENGKEVQASFGTPFTVPDNLSFLPSDLLVEPSRMPQRPDTMIVFDVGAPDRLGELAGPASEAKTLIVIDHHVTNQGFGDITLIDGDASSTGEIVFRLIRELGWEMEPSAALCLLTSLVTDTGRFQYSNTRPETLRVAADLVEAGARPDVISRHVYEEAPFGYLVVAAAALGRAVLDEEAAMVSAVVTYEDLDQAGIGWGDIDNLIDTLRLAKEADVALLLKVHEDGRVKASLRSRGATDVGGLATEWGGGGHRLAAGFTVDDDPEALVEKVRDRIGAFR